MSPCSHATQIKGITYLLILFQSRKGMVVSVVGGEKGCVCLWWVGRRGGCVCGGWGEGVCVSVVSGEKGMCVGEECVSGCRERRRHVIGDQIHGLLDKT